MDFLLLLLVFFSFSSSISTKNHSTNSIDLDSPLILLLKPGSASDPSRKSVLPLASSPEVFADSKWSSYRPQLYFGLRNRRPNSPMFGLMWNNSNNNKTTSGDIELRHWARHEDKVVFSWDMHDGRSFGSQRIVDGQMGMRTEWLNFGAGSWMARLHIDANGGGTVAPDREEKGGGGTDSSLGTASSLGTDFSLVLYLALQDALSSMRVRPVDGGKENQQKGGQQLPLLEGNCTAVAGGTFSLRVNASPGRPPTSLSLLALRLDPFPDMANVSQLVTSQLRLANGSLTFGNHHQQQQNVQKGTNLAAIQISVKSHAVVEVLFQCAEDKQVPSFAELFKRRADQFQDNFDRAFPIEKSAPALHHKMGHAALANLLGGIGVWHGHVWMHSSQFRPSTLVKPYGPLSVISAVPSRTGFPRGFVWDEGFHNLLIHKFDPQLSIQILGAYLDLMNADGWIPRELPIGSEAEARIPGIFLVQEDWVANPPMFFYVLRDMVNSRELVRRFRPDLVRLYPRMKQLFLWLWNTQRGPRPGSFRWRGRNASDPFVLNAPTLASGFDDFPRASHPSAREYHLDLRCWMAVSASVLLQLAAFAGDDQFVPAIRREAARLNDVDTLDRLHWSERANRYSDYGLHSEAVELVPMETAGRGGKRQMIMQRRVGKQPSYGFVEDANGYANLFPLLLKLLPAHSPRLAPLLRQMAHPSEFWSPFGLRSLSTLSPYYNAFNRDPATPFSAPYWRGAIWINMNYFALDALHHYSSLDGPQRAECARLYVHLRENVLSNVARQYERTGFFWEHYDDRDGHGADQHPFTGWTTLVLKIMAENY